MANDIEHIFMSLFNDIEHFFMCSLAIHIYSLEAVTNFASDFHREYK